MAEYLISFNDGWVPDHTPEELRATSETLRPLIAQMRNLGVLIFTGGLDDTAPACYVSVSDGEPAFTDGPRTLGPERLGGFAVVSVDSEQSARHWAGRIAAACGWPQEVRRFLPGPGDPSSAAR